MVVKCYCYNSVQKCSKRIALVLCFEINKVVSFEVCFNVMLKIVSIEWRKKAENKKCYNVIVINVLICYGITVYCTKKVYKNMHSERA